MFALDMDDFCVCPSKMAQLMWFRSTHLSDDKITF